jgi:hypothetical protein
MCAYTSAAIAIEELSSSFDMGADLGTASEHEAGRGVAQTIERQLRKRLTLLANLLEVAADVARIERLTVLHREGVPLRPPRLRGCLRLFLLSQL